MNRADVRLFLGEDYELRARRADGGSETVNIVGVIGTGNEANAYHREYLIVSAGTAQDKAVPAPASAIFVWDKKEQKEQGRFGHNRNLGDILATWHPKGIDKRGCFERLSGHNAYTCGRPAKVSYETKELKAKKALPRWGDRNPSPQYFCGGHDPVKRQKQRDERDAKSREKRQREQAEWDRREREDKERHRRANLYDELVAALAAIMDGEGGDPSELARRALMQAKEIKG